MLGWFSVVIWALVAPLLIAVYLALIGPIKDYTPDRYELSKSRHSSPTQSLARAPPSAPDTTSEAALAAQPKAQSAPELPAKVEPTAEAAPDVTPEPALAAIAATPAPAPEVTPEPALAAVAATPAPAPEVTPEPALAAIAATPAPAPEVTPEPALAAIAATPAPAPDVTPESALAAIAPASDTLRATNAAPISVPQAATPAPNRPAVQLDSDEMTRLIKRGKDFLAQGNFASARLLFKRAADAGSAEAALALGSTYDPSVIKQLGAVSITPDIDGALKWYETAANHGSAEAAGLFANLMRLRQNQR